MTPQKSSKIQDENLFRFIAFGGSYLLWRCGVAARATVKFICKGSHWGYIADAV